MLRDTVPTESAKEAAIRRVSVMKWGDSLTMNRPGPAASMLLDDVSNGLLQAVPVLRPPVEELDLDVSESELKLVLSSE